MNVEDTRRKDYFNLSGDRVDIVEQALDEMKNGLNNIDNMITHRFNFNN